MPEIAQYNFSVHEVAVTLLKANGIKTGKWSFGVTFGINIGNFGPSEETTAPAVMALIQNLNIQRVPDETPESNTVIDASKI